MTATKKLTEYQLSTEKLTMTTYQQLTIDFQLAGLARSPLLYMTSYAMYSYMYMFYCFTAAVYTIFVHVKYCT